MKRKMWCVYHKNKKGVKIYDITSLAPTYKESIEKFVGDTIGVSWHDYQILWSWQIEQVTLPIETR